jgi:hypothetical protein
LRRMRIGIAPVIGLALVGTLSAGCSSSPGTGSLPGSATAEQSMTQHTGAPHWMHPHGFGSSKELLKLQAEGKILSPLTLAASKWGYNRVANGTRPAFHPIHSDVGVGHGLQLSHRNE